MTITAGVIGYGYWGPNLVRNLADSDGIELAWCADKRAERRALVARRYAGLPIAEDPNKVIDDPAVDAVVIATPVSTHYELAKRALSQGKHVLVTKPLSQTVDEADELIEQAEKNELVLMIDHTFVYTGAVRRMREILEAGDLGDLLYFDSVRVNLGLFQHDVDVIWDLAPHDLSILGHLVGKDPNGVMAIGADHTGSGLADMAYLTLVFGDSFLAHAHVNWLSPVKVRRILIGGSRRMMVYDDMEPSEKVRIYDRGIEISSRDHVYETLVDYRSGDMWAPKLEVREALSVEIAHFIDCVEGRDTPRSDGHSGLAVLKVLAGASESLSLGGRQVAV